MPEPAACPRHRFGAEFDPLDLNDPFPLLAAARREQPVFYSAAIDYWVVTRHEDVKAIFRDHETYTAANTITPIVPSPRPSRSCWPSAITRRSRCFPTTCRRAIRGSAPWSTASSRRGG